MAADAVRTADQIIAALAAGRGLVTPVPEYFPLGRSFAEQCIREAYLDVIQSLSDSVQTAEAAHRGAEVHALHEVLKLVANALNDRTPAMPE